MAAKKDKLSTNNNEVDDDLDIPDIDFDAAMPKDDRNPVTKFVTGIGAGAVGSVVNESFIRKQVKDVMPSGYGEALDFQQDVTRGAKQLYNTAAKEIKPSLLEMAKAADRLLPQSATKTREKLQKLRAWAGETKPGYSGDDKAAQRDKGIEASLREVFEYQQEEQIKTAAVEESKQKVTEGLELIRHRDNFGLLNSINQGITRLYKYQDKLTAAYQKKSLEIQFRSYFLAIDNLEESKRQNAITSEMMATIAKNTGLPDYVKINESERAANFLRNKFAEGASNYLFGGRNDFVNGVVEKSKSALREKLSGTVDAFTTAASAMEEFADAKEQINESGIDKVNLAGSIAGGVGINAIAGKLGKKAKNYFAKNDNLVKKGLQLKSGLASIPQQFNTYRKGSKFDDDGTDLSNLLGGGEKADAFAKGRLGQILSSILVGSKDFIPDFQTDGTVQQDKSSDLTKASAITNQTNKSLNEIIPGYLARILREVQVIRTGDDSTSMTVYDYTKNKFITQAQSDKNLIGRISSLSVTGRKEDKKLLKKGEKFDKDRAGPIKDQIDEILKMVGAEKILSREEQLALGKYLVKRNANTDLGTADSLTSKDAYTKDGISEADSIKYAKVFKSYYGGTDTPKDRSVEFYKKQDEFVKRFNILGSSVEDTRSFIQEMINLGNYEQLERLGIVDIDKGKIDFNKILDYNLDFEGVEGFNESSGTAKVPARRLKSKVAKTKVVTMAEKIKKPRNETSYFSESREYSPEEFGQTEVTSDLVKAINENSSKSETAQAVDTLSKIEQLIAASNKAQEAYFTELINKTTNTYNVNSKGITISPGSFVKGVWKLSKSAADGALNAVKRTTGIATGLAGNALTTASRIGRKAFGIATDQFTNTRELYLKNSLIPLISEAKLKTGRYIDSKTGETIKKFEDIKGTVIDRVTGSVILRQEDFKDIFIKSKPGASIVKFGKQLIEQAKKAIGNVTSIASLIPSTAMSVGKYGLDVMKDLLDQPTDIYIKGSKDPVMLARVMSAGAYFLKSNKSIIDKPSKITGSVIDATGNVVLTDEELRAGIFDKRGNPISSGIVKLIGIGVGLSKAVLSTANNIRKRVTSVLSGGLGKLKGIAGSISDKFSGDWNIQFGGLQVDMLTKIYQLLDSRMPGKKVFGDNDGDGNREGSWRTIGKKGFKTAVKPGTIAENKKEAGPKGKSMLESLKDRYDKYRDKKDSLRDIADAAGDLGDASRDSKRRRRRAKLARAGGRLGGAARTGGSLLGRGAGMLGRGALGAGRIALALGGLGIGSVGSVLGGAASLGGAAISGTASLIGGAAGLAGTVLGGIGAVLTSPVILGALALGAVGVGGYYAYKYLTAKTSKLVSYRTTQYGFGPTAPKDAAKTLELEDLLAPCVYYETGVAKLSEKNFDVKKAVGLFNVSPEDQDAYETWVKWFQYRFKPVYLTHLTALLAANPKAKLSDVDSLKPEEKVNYLNLARFQDGPYDYSDKPDKTSDIRLADSKDVDEAYLAAKAEVDAEMSGKSSKLAPGAAAVAGVTYDAAGNIVSNGDTTNQPKTAMDRIKEQQGKVTDYSKGAIAAGTTSGTMVVTGQNAVDKGAETIDILEGIRLRCYGLINMETAKVSALRKLEDLISKHVVYDGNGNATYKADDTDSLVAGGMFFGISQGTPSAENWNKWYQTRFLPVFLSYLGMVRQMTGSAVKPGIKPSLKNSQALTIANQLVATKGIWNINTSPWDGYFLNIDDYSIKPFIQALTDLAKNDTTNEAIIAKNNVSKPTTMAETTPPSQTAKDAIVSKGNNPSAYVAPEPDAEPQGLDKAGAATMTVNQPGSNAPMAGGPILDGHGAKQYLSLGKNAKLDGVNPAMLKQFLGMVEEYGQMTGKTVHLESAYRSYEDQVRLRREKGNGAAQPGTSLHEVGLAMDVTSTTLNELEKLGLMRKYGFTRPVGGEAWHMEPAGIQTNLATYRADPNAAAKAIAAGMGRGGGGMGTIANAERYKRNSSVASKALEAPIPQPEALSPTPLVKAFVPTMVGQAPGVVPNATGKPEVLSAAGPTGMQYDAMGNAIGNYDAEPTPGSAPSKSKSEILGSFSGRIGNQGQPVVPNQGRGGAMEAVIPGTTVAIGSMPTYKGGKGYGSVKDIILAAAKAVGIDPKLMVPVAAIESSFDPMAKAGSSSAKGLFQFVDKTWEEVTNRYGKKYGITPQTSPFDPVANSLMGAEYIKQNAKSIGGVKSNPNSTDMYAAHMLGAAGATRLFKADPNAIAASILPDAANSNIPIFYDKSRPRTVSEVYSLYASKMSNAIAQTGIGSEFSAGDGRMTGMMTAAYTAGQAPTVTPALALNTPPTTTGSSDYLAARQPVIPPAPAMMASTMGINNGSQASPVPQERSDMSAVMGSVSNTLTQSLVVQTQMLDVLKNILNAGVKLPGSTPSNNGIDGSKPKVQTSDTTSNNSYSRAGMNSDNVVPVPMSRV